MNAKKVLEKACIVQHTEKNLNLWQQQGSLIKYSPNKASCRPHRWSDHSGYNMMLVILKTNCLNLLLLWSQHITGKYYTTKNVFPIWIWRLNCTSFPQRIPHVSIPLNVFASASSRNLWQRSLGKITPLSASANWANKQTKPKRERQRERNKKAYVAYTVKFLKIRQYTQLQEIIKD